MQTNLKRIVTGLALITASVVSAATVRANILQYHGGPVLGSFQMVPYYYGPASAQWNQKISEHQNYLNLIASYISGQLTPNAKQTMLQQYGVWSASVASRVVTFGGTAGPITTTQALDLIHTGQTAGIVPPFENDRLILLVLAPGYSISGVSGGCSYHATDGPGKWYAVITADCGPWLAVSGHEIFEAAMDPDVATGWDESVDGCGTTFFGLVPGVWDNRLGGVCSATGYDMIQTPASVNTLTGYVRFDNISSVIYRNGPNHVRELGLYGGAWAVGDLSTATGAPLPVADPAAFVRSDNRTSVVYRDASNHLQEMRLTAGNWDARDLTALTGAPLATGIPVGYVRADGVSTVVYRSSGDNHIREIGLYSGQWLGPEGTWSVGDLTATTGAPAAVGDPAVYVRSDGRSAVVYRSSDNHIRELLLTGQSWAAGDLSAAAGAPAASGNPSPYVRSDGSNTVVYRSTDNHIRELGLFSGAWTVGDLSAITGAPNAVSDPYGYVRSDGVSAVVYRSTSDNHIREISLAVGTFNWSAADLSGLTGAPAATGRPTAYVRADGISTVVFKSSGDSHIRELRRFAGSWFAGDLTAATGGTP
jgi:hypothetical protein